MSSARTDLCGGRPVMVVPTATSEFEIGTKNVAMSRDTAGTSARATSGEQSWLRSHSQVRVVHLLHVPYPLLGNELHTSEYFDPSSRSNVSFRELRVLLSDNEP